MKKDDAFYLRFCYAAFGFVVFFVFSKAFETVGLQTGWAERFYEWFSVATTAVSLVVAVLALWYLIQDKERHEYFLSSIGELRKVSWPTAVDTRRMTVIVCVVVFIFAVILAIFDEIWAFILKLVI
jgi:preprotein translocase subunit SecE